MKLVRINNKTGEREVLVDAPLLERVEREKVVAVIDLGHYYRMVMECGATTYRFRKKEFFGKTSECLHKCYCGRLFKTPSQLEIGALLSLPVEDTNSGTNLELNAKDINL